MSAPIFRIRLTVPPSAIDARDHVNNLVYLEWCMRIATEHWEAEASQQLREEYVWYVLNHNISYKAAAFLGDEVEVSTWVTFAEGVKSERAFEVRRVKDQVLLAEAKTLWCLMDSKSLRPAMITEEIRNLFI